MKKLSLSILEKRIGKKLSCNTTAIGFDTASKFTGIGVIITLKKTAYVSTYLIKNKKIIEGKGKNRELKEEKFREALDYFIGELNNLISNKIKTKGYKKFIIEQPFFSKNVQTLIILQAYATLVWRETKHIPDEIRFVRPVTCRSIINFFKNRNKKDKRKQKEQVKDYINYIFGLNLKDDNLTDGLALSLSALIKPTTTH